MPWIIKQLLSHTACLRLMGACEIGQLVVNMSAHCYRFLYFAHYIGSLSKPRRRRQRERHKTKGLMSKTIAVHVRYKSLYNSLPSSAKRQREMTKFCVVYGTWTTAANFSFFHLELNAVVAYLVSVQF